MAYNPTILTALHTFINNSFTQSDIAEIRQRMLLFGKELTCVLPYSHLRILWRLRQTATFFFSFLSLRKAYVKESQKFHVAILTNVPILQCRCVIWSHLGWKNKSVAFLDFRHVGRFYINLGSTSQQNTSFGFGLSSEQVLMQPNFISEPSCCYMCRLVCMLLAKHITDFRRPHEDTCCTNGKCKGWLTSEYSAWHCHYHSNSRQHLLLLCFSPTATVMVIPRSTFLASYPR